MFRNRNRRRRPTIEILEGRQLLTVVYDPISDHLLLDGSLGNDMFAVSQISVGGKDAIRVQEGPVVTVFPTATQPILQITADLKDGTDVLSMGSNVSIPLYADGGIGNDSIRGGAQANEIRGGDGNDTLVGGPLKDLIYGGDNNDTITGLEGDDFLYGEDPMAAQSGQDTIYGGPGKDTIFGYLGNDFLYGEGEDDTIHGGEDSEDHIEGNDGNDDLYGEGGNDDIWGDDGEDFILGGEGNDTMHGGLMDDYLQGDQDIDQIYGDEGNDALDGGPQADFLYGNAGTDILSGGGDNDLLVGDDPFAIPGFDTGNDILFGGDGDDTLQGGGGDDELDGGEDDDRLDGGDGNDILHGDSGFDTLRGGIGNDRLYGEEDDDNLFGDDGDDNLYAGSGIDYLEGGNNDDTLVSIDDDDADILWGQAGLDSFWVDKIGGGLGGATTDVVFDADPNEADYSLHEVEEFENGADKTLDGDNIAEPAGGVRWKDFWNKPLFASGGPTMSDVRQGSLADCWLLSSLAAAAGASPNAIRQLVVDLGDGTFAVQLNEKQYRLDAELAVFDEHPDNIKYAGLGNEGSLWVALVEEAYAMYRGNDYENMNNDIPYFPLGKIGGEDRHWPLDPNYDNVLVDADAPGIGAVYCTDLDDDDVSVLTSGHCYAIVSVTYDSVGVPTHVTLYNPYGEDDDNYYGDCSDDGFVTITVGELDHDKQTPWSLIYADFGHFNWA